jgi:hypothetical protein
MLRRPDSFPDLDTMMSKTDSMRSQRPHGNAKAQEPAYMELRRTSTGKLPRMAGHIHARPWSLTCQPGKKEVDTMSNEMRRTWHIDNPRDGGRWNRARKKAFYEAQDEAMRNLRPMDEVCATPSTQKLYTHLMDGCATKGGQHKLNYMPDRKKDCQHLKSSIYHGKYENVEPKQLILCDREEKNPNGTIRRINWEIDSRNKFNTHPLNEFVTKVRHQELKLSVTANFDTMRPRNTTSCPEMGADYMHR